MGSHVSVKTDKKLINYDVRLFFFYILGELILYLCTKTYILLRKYQFLPIIF